MALFGKDDRTQRPEDPHAGVPAMPRFPDERSPVVDAADTQAQTLLGKGSRVEGKLIFEGSVKIDGVVEGEIGAPELGNLVGVGHGPIMLLRGPQVKAPGRPVVHITGRSQQGDV